jgi:hypothetical protein
LPGHSRTSAAQQHRTLLGVGQLAGQNLGEAISERVMLKAGGRAILSPSDRPASVKL